MKVFLGSLIASAGVATSLSTFRQPTVLLPRGNAGASPAAAPMVAQARFRQRRLLCLAQQKGPGNVERIPNEFSRTYRTDRVLGSGPGQRDYSISMEATQGERLALAERFNLSCIDELEANVCMRRESAQSKGSANRVSGVEVEGTVRARVTQTCVRTNEDFNVGVEFPLFAIVRPVESIFDTRGTGDPADNLSELDSYLANHKKGGTKRKQKSVRAPGRKIDDMDMMELQQILQDFDVEDEVMEDESIYSMDGEIDIGELVSQLFWLNLDPYPKKPGTDPVQASISG